MDEITRRGETMTIGTLGSITLDCADPQELGAFWSQVTGAEVAHSTEEFVGLKLPGMWLGAVRVPDYQPPKWPDGDVPAQLHFDIKVADLAAAEGGLLEAGARRAEHQPAPDRWLVLLDPAGHPFCITTELPD
jgi:catechol 2,3-dioxygenase-like lactoylglutathione lyase family enzyme